MITPKVNDTKVVLGPCRLSYVHLFAKYKMDGDTSEGKYMATILIPKEEKETLAAVKKAIKTAQDAAISGKWKGKEPKKIQLPLRDGDERDDGDEDFAGHYYMNAKCNTRPGVCDKNKKPIMDEEEVYSGMWGYVSVTFFPYDVSGNKGIACGLNNVMKFKDGERMGGRIPAERDFADIDDLGEDEDDDLY